MKLELETSDSSLIDLPLRTFSGAVSYVVGFGGLVVVWYVTAKLVGRATFLPGPELVAKTLVSLALGGELFPNVVASLGRVLIGFSIGATTGILLGIVIGLFPRAESAFEPIVELARSIPPYAMIPFAILAFGTGPEGKFFVLAYATFFPVLISTINGLSNVPPCLVDAAFTLGASRLFTIARVMLPSAVPQIMVGLRLGFGLAWLSLIAAEMVAASEGLGFMIADGRELLQTNVVMAGMIVIGILGYMFNRLFVFVEQRLRTHES
jgi:ABC-type nitrate/sulfonate/bicarbonate transport system permease component